MPIGKALCIGLNFVDENHYDGWDGKLNCCENDAQAMASILKGEGFKIETILTDKATSDNITNKIKNQAVELNSGDIFCIYYSGHGGSINDLSMDEEDDKDETWCLYDRQLLDDELYKLWPLFKEGVRILVISDSCHSGTIVKEIAFSSDSKIIPFDLSAIVYRKHKKDYDNILKNKKKRMEVEDKIKASIIFLSACQDNQTALAGWRHSLFTLNLFNTWNKGKFNGDYLNFHGRIVKKSPPDHTPGYVRLGQSNIKFERQKPFTL